MPCYKPLKAVRVHVNHEHFWTKNGKFKLWFGKKADSLLRSHGEFCEELFLPCNQCIGCMNRRTSDWGVRCWHESQFWDCGSFVTLTYATEFLPAKRSLVKSDLQKFFKRLRMDLERNHNGAKIRYFACGEYGEEKGRPHYHALIFGWDFPDRVPTKNNPWASEELFESAQLSEIWGMGKCTLGVTIGGQSANYVAKYALKKAYGKKGKAEYADTGRVAPFSCMSHGIGDRWFARYKSDLYPSDFVVSEDGSKKLPVPRRYDRLLSEISEEYMEFIKMRRQSERKANPADETLERLAVREMVARAAAKAASERRLERREFYRNSQNESGIGGANKNSGGEKK